MEIFYLPDLGEGLPDAEVHEWHVKVGDKVEKDQLLVSMETAKAVVEVPSPQQGTIKKLYGNVGDIINTGTPLVEFESSGEKTAATVAGKLQVSDNVLTEPAAGITRQARERSIKALPAARQLAQKLNIDLSQVRGSGPGGQITTTDVQAQATSNAYSEAITGVRRTMAQAMSRSHQEVVPVTLMDDADLSAWLPENDITARIIRALCKACAEVPALNAWFDGPTLTRELFSDVQLGLAIDSEDGLFVPVLKKAQSMPKEELRATINTYKQQVKERTIPQQALHGATITLSNFGVFAGRYGNPIVVPPTVAIVGTGKIRKQGVFNEANGNWENHSILPLSLTFDHRAATGGEASRFMATLIQELQQKE